ncbi:Uncharacterized protein MA16_Dca000065 [Dendrobium catenatum]|uniref:Uncharacterized protein n=1 Tax=Dendrobium catenatum TaxID=906689 RepID=A0A2I0WST3_9ASPA|nr:Uncharacterized protein MA16_Dca000065 [Dendrobium catenatum]
MVWSKGAWFFHGKPFIVQKWTKKFNHTRENFSSVPVWVRIHKLPLVCWNSEGISKIASKVGIPIAVDSLTAAKTRLTYARVCIQVSTSSTFPESVAVSIEGEIFKLQIQYEWKPVPCSICASLAHASTNCPSATPSQKISIPPSRGRSFSRGQRKKSHSRSKVPTQKFDNGTSSLVHPPASLQNPPASGSNTNLFPSQVIWVPKGISTVSHIAVTTAHPDSSTQMQTGITIPNLNSPTDEGLGDTDFGQASLQNPYTVKISNKYSSLLGSEDQTVTNSDNEGTSFSEQTSNTTGGGGNPRLLIQKILKGKAQKSLRPQLLNANDLS